MAKAGMIQALYVGEFIGLLFIWGGYYACVQGPPTLPEPGVAGAAAAERGESAMPAS